VVKLSIGLDFVKKIDTNWDKRLISIDQMDDKDYFEKSIYKYNENYEKSDTSDIEKKIDYWEFWKKRYSIIR
jgi:hypothetical protein